MAPAPLSTGFPSPPPLPTIKLGPSGAGSRVGGLVHALGPCGSLQWPLLWGWESLLLPPQPPRAFSIRSLRLYFPRAGSLGCVVCFTPRLWMNVYFLFPWCRTFLPFNFLSALVVRGGSVCLPTPPSWFSIHHQFLRYNLYIIKCTHFNVYFNEFWQVYILVYSQHHHEQDLEHSQSSLKFPLGLFLGNTPTLSPRQLLARFSYGLF